MSWPSSKSAMRDGGGNGGGTKLDIDLVGMGTGPEGGKDCNGDL